MSDLRHLRRMEKVMQTLSKKIMQTALRLYEALIDETESGKQFLVRDADGVVSRFKMFL